jgi:hypothetical protein
MITNGHKFFGWNLGETPKYKENALKEEKE